MQVIAYVYMHLFKSSCTLLERKIQAVLIIGVQACHKNCLKMLKTSLIYLSFDKLNAHDMFLADLIANTVYVWFL